MKEARGLLTKYGHRSDSGNQGLTVWMAIGLTATGLAATAHRRDGLARALSRMADLRTYELVIGSYLQDCDDRNTYVEESLRALIDMWPDNDLRRVDEIIRRLQALN